MKSLSNVVPFVLVSKYTPPVVTVVLAAAVTLPFVQYVGFIDILTFVFSTGVSIVPNVISIVLVCIKFPATSYIFLLLFLSVAPVVNNMLVSFVTSDPFVVSAADQVELYKLPLYTLYVSEFL